MLVFYRECLAPHCAPPRGSARWAWERCGSLRLAPAGPPVAPAVLVAAVAQAAPTKGDAPPACLSGLDMRVRSQCCVEDEEGEE